MRLAVQHAPLGALTRRLVLTWYVAPDLTEDEREDLQVAGTLILADLPDELHIDERFIEVADLSARLRAAGTWVVLRRGVRTTGDFAEPS